MAILSKNTTIGGSKPHTLASLPVSVVGNELTFKGNKVMLTYSKRLGNEENLNNFNEITHAGIYVQPLNANATLENNYPVQLAGTLVVLDCIPVVQIYYTYNRSSMYIRGKYNLSEFSEWNQMANQKDYIVLKEFIENEIDKLNKNKQNNLEFVGNLDGRVMKEGAGGILKSNFIKFDAPFSFQNKGTTFGITNITKEGEDLNIQIHSHTKGGVAGSYKYSAIYTGFNKIGFMYSINSYEWSKPFDIYHENNTTYDKSGFLKNKQNNLNAITEDKISYSLESNRDSYIASEKLTYTLNLKVEESQSTANRAIVLSNQAQNSADNAYSQANSAMQHANNAMSFSGTRLGISDLRGHNRLIKEKTNIPCFIKKNANTISILKNTNVVLENGKLKSFKENEDVKLIGSHIKGSDYVVYIDNNGKLFSIIDNFESPATILDNCFIIGGYHYGQIPENETLSSGEFATTGNGMIWTQEDVNKIRGINEFSIWDLRFRSGGIIRSPLSSRYNEMSNHGMVYDSNTNRWFAIYHASTEVDKYGISRSGTNIASGTILPIIPSAYNGDGSKKYNNLNWWTANELANSQGSRLLWEYEFNSRAFGVTENKTAGGASVTYPKTERIKGLTSKIGCEQTVGTHYYWGLDTSFRNDGTNWSWKDETKGRGQLYTQGTYGNVKAIFGGHRTDGVSYVGSRVVYWASPPWASVWNIGVVATRDSLIL